jgi:hypothetical protein
MSAGESTATPPEPDSFESLLDSTCSRLWDRKLRYVLRRIRELAEILDRADQELGEVLLRGNAGSGAFVASPPAEAPAVEAALEEKQPGQMRP